MKKKWICILACFVALALAMLPLFAQQRGGQTGTPKEAAGAAGQRSAPARPAVVQMDGLAGERNFVVGVQPPFVWARIEVPVPKVPEGFTLIFNGQNLTGWHASVTNHHGRAPHFYVLNGVLVGTQEPYGEGGILLTDKSYKNFELYMEVKPDYGCDSGVFFRSTEAGGAYQVMMDYLPGGSMGRLGGEATNGPPPGSLEALSAPPVRGVLGAGGPAAVAGGDRGPGRGGRPVVGGIPLGSTTPNGDEPWMKAWKREAWNSFRLRVVGDIPHVTVWINDQIVTDVQEETNRAPGGMVSGPIAIQMHGGIRWVPAGLWRWRNIGIKELP